MSGAEDYLGIRALLNKICTMQRNGKNAAAVWADVEDEYRRIGCDRQADQVAKMRKSIGR